MNKVVAHSIQIYCAFLLFVVVCSADVEMNEEKRYSNERRLLPFPRVGRRESAMKLARLRHELFAFPRTGRSQSVALDMKRSGTKTMNTGLWFGPRLGRVQKRNLYAITPDIDDYYISTAETDGRQVVPASVRYSPRLGHASNEDLELGQPLVEDS